MSGSHKQSSVEVCNYSKTLERLEGDRELFTKLVELFLRLCPKQMTDIRDAIVQEDAAGLAKTAHIFKGSLTQFCAAASVEAAELLLQIGRAGTLSEADAAYATLEYEITRLTEALKQHGRAA